MIITKSGQKSDIAHWKNDKKNDEESLQLHGLVKKTTKKFMNQDSNFEELYTIWEMK